MYVQLNVDSLGHQITKKNIRLVFTASLKVIFENLCLKFNLAMRIQNPSSDKQK